MELNLIWLCDQVAAELNRADGSDYRAALVDEQDNIADALLVSDSGRWPQRLLQVTTIPRDLQHRETSSNRDRVEQRLKEALESHQTDCIITLHLSEQGNEVGLKPQHIKRLAQLVRDSSGQPIAEWTGEQLWQADAELSDRVSHMTVHRLPGYGKIDVTIPLSRYMPPEGSWIHDAITQKAKRYGLDTVKNVVLVIGALGLVTPSNTASFQAAHAQEQLPFAEIWLVSPFDGVTCLKRSARA